MQTNRDKGQTKMTIIEKTNANKIYILVFEAPWASIVFGQQKHDEQDK